MDAPVTKSDQIITSDVLVGKQVGGQYTITEQLGAGAWGTVYLANHAVLSRRVAIKILHAHLVSNSEKLQRFKQEAEAVSRLTHPNLVSVFDYGVLEDGSPYIVMELVRGRSLERMLEEKELSQDDLLSVFKQLASALSAAHSQAIIHRDVKPSNVIIRQNSDGAYEAKLVDFGLAKLIDDNAQVTGTGETLGTPAYMSPEQCYGLPTGAPSDIYSLGCIMYEAFTGKKTASGATVFECMKAHIESYPSRFNQAAPGKTFARGLEDVVFKTLAKEAGQRYQTADELLQEIDAVAKGTGAGIKKHADKLTQKRAGKTMLAIAAVSLAVLLLCVGTTALYFNRFDTATQNQSGTLDKLDDDADRALGMGNLIEAERLLVAAKEKAMRTFGRLSRPYQTQLRKLADLYSATANKARLTEIQQELSYVDADFKYGTPEQNSKEIIKLSMLVNSSKADKDTYQQLIKVLTDQAALSCIKQQLADAEDLLKQALTVRDRYGGDTAQSARIYNDLGWLHQNLNDFSLAEKETIKALEILKQIGQSDSEAAAKYTANLGAIYLHRKQYDLAEQQYRLARATKAKIEGERSAAVAKMDTALAGLYLLQDKQDLAEASLTSALRIQRPLYQGSHPDLADTLYELGMLNSKRNRSSSAEGYFREALAIYEREFGPRSPSVAMALFQLGSEYQHQGRVAEAAPLFARAKAIRANLTPGATSHMSPGD